MSTPLENVRSYTTLIVPVLVAQYQPYTLPACHANPLLKHTLYPPYELVNELYSALVACIHFLPSPERLEEGRDMEKSQQAAQPKDSATLVSIQA